MSSFRTLKIWHKVLQIALSELYFPLKQRQSRPGLQIFNRNQRGLTDVLHDQPFQALTHTQGVSFWPLSAPPGSSMVLIETFFFRGSLQ